MPERMVLKMMLPGEDPRRSGRRPCNKTGSLQLLLWQRLSRRRQGCSHPLLHSLLLSIYLTSLPHSAVLMDTHMEACHDLR